MIQSIYLVKISLLNFCVVFLVIYRMETARLRIRLAASVVVVQAWVRLLPSPLLNHLLALRSRHLGCRVFRPIPLHRLLASLLQGPRLNHLPGLRPRHLGRPVFRDNPLRRLRASLV